MNAASVQFFYLSLSKLGKSLRSALECLGSFRLLPRRFLAAGTAEVVLFAELSGLLSAGGHTRR